MLQILVTFGFAYWLVLAIVVGDFAAVCLLWWAFGLDD